MLVIQTCCLRLKGSLTIEILRPVASVLEDFHRIKYVKLPNSLASGLRVIRSKKEAMLDK
jgi:hypothetical protein